MDIVCLGQQNWHVCWTAKQQLMTRLARRGHRVLYVDPTPTTPGDGDFRTVREFARNQLNRGIEQIAENLWLFHMVQPCERRSLRRALQENLLRRALKQLQMLNPTVVCMTPFQRRLAESIKPFALVYYTVDEWCEFAGTPDSQKPMIRAEEELLASRAKVVLAVSPKLCERLREVNARCYLQENGVDTGHFSPQSLAARDEEPLLTTLPRPRIGFVGQVDARLDQELLAHLAMRHQSWRFVLVGRVVPSVDFGALRALPNIHFCDYAPYERLPTFIKGFDVCIVPYRRNELTNSCNPLKVYEYLATGLPIVSTDLDGLGATRGYLNIAKNHDEFERQIQGALHNPHEGREERLAAARENSWENRVSLLEHRLEEAVQIAASSDDRKRQLFKGSHKVNFKVPLDPKERSLEQLSVGSGGFITWQSLFYQATRAAGLMYYAGRVAARIATRKEHVRVRKILVTRHGCLGDLVTFTPALAAIRRSFPGARIVLGVRNRTPVEGILSGTCDVDEVRVLDFLSRKSRLDRLGGALSLFLQGYDLLVSGISYFQVAEGYFCGAPKRVGLYDGHALQKHSNRLVPIDCNRHESDNNLAIAEALGAHPTIEQRMPFVAMDPESLRAVWNHLSGEIVLPPENCYILIHPGSKQLSRRWPVESFAALVTHILENYPHLHVVLTGTPNEQKLGDVIAAETPPELRPRICNTIGRTGLHAVAGLIDRSLAVISNDTGVMHLARARGKKLLALLGPENDRRWGPYPWGAAPAISIRHQVPCSPCRQNFCPHQFCMRLLSLEEVAAALKELINRQDNADTKPIEVSRIHHSYSWQELHARGFELPQVAVVTDNAETAMAVAKAYPRLQFVHCDEKAGIERWNAALAKTDADYLICPHDPGAAISRIGELVADLMRAPDAAGISNEKLHNLEETRRLFAQGAELMLNRETVAQLIAEQLESPRQSKEIAIGSGLACAEIR